MPRGEKSASSGKNTPETPGKWSQDVTDNSDALDLKDGVFKQRSAKKIADSLKHSAEQSHRRKASPFQSAMSMLNFYINRAGKQLPKSRLATLERAKDELRKDFGKQPRH
jgi:hypothetical protein